ncbi:MAG TPA: hypothetical protein VK688_07235, partial [Gemmatimonadales bacterium]|nr:hypothetical protein [Gemmatimonadales bacterium]
VTASQALSGALDPGKAARLVFNDRLDASVAAVFMIVTVILVAACIREWALILARRKTPVARETPFVETAYAS